MDIIFLDIDGVLRTTASDIWWSDKLIQPIPDSIFKRRFSPTSVSLINQLDNITKAKIVITSTWKTFYKFEDLKKELFSRGLVSDIIDITPVLQNRGTEIQCWLDINSVNKYAVIDDNINDIIGHINPGKIIKCSPSIGFTEIEFEKAIAQMNKTMANDIETLFILPTPELSAINSTIIRDIVRNGGDASPFVPVGVDLKL